MLKSASSHQGESYSVSKDFSMNPGPKKKKKSYNVRAYKLVIGGGVHFPDATIPPSVMTLSELMLSGGSTDNLQANKLLQNVPDCEVT